MSPEQQRIAIAEACGKTVVTYEGLRDQLYWRENDTVLKLPDYLVDLNAMHEAEYHPSITCNYPRYVREIAKLLPASDSNTAQFADLAVCHATAAQRAEAFLRTLGKWEKEE